MSLVLDALRLTAALCLVGLALAAVLDRHQPLILHLGRIGEGALRGVVWGLTFGRVRVPQIIRTSRRRQARRRRLRRLEASGTRTPNAAGGPGWQVGRQEPPRDWSDDDGPPGLG